MLHVEDVPAVHVVFPTNLTSFPNYMYMYVTMFEAIVCHMSVMWLYRLGYLSLISTGMVMQAWPNSVRLWTLSTGRLLHILYSLLGKLQHMTTDTYTVVEQCDLPGRSSPLRQTPEQPVCTHASWKAKRKRILPTPTVQTLSRLSTGGYPSQLLPRMWPQRHHHMLLYGNTWTKPSTFLFLKSLHDTTNAWR